MIVGRSGNFSETLFKNSKPDIPGILISVIIRSGLFEFSANNASDALEKDSTLNKSSSALVQIVLILSSSSIIQILVIFITPNRQYNSKFCLTVLA